MSKLTEQQHLVLRLTLGLSHWTRVPTGNSLPGGYVDKYLPVIQELIALGLMERRHTHGPCGIEYFYVITDAGREIALAHQEEAK